MENKKNSKLSVVQETQYGVYVWLTHDNKIVMNENGDYLSVTAREGDLQKMTALASAAKYYGIPPGGRALFLPGRRKVTDEEYEEQKARLAMGLTPDIYDAPALRDEIRDKRQNS